MQLASLVSRGRLNKEISYILGITEGTVKVYLSHLFSKLGVANRAELSAWAVRHDGEIEYTQQTSPAGKVVCISCGSVLPHGGSGYLGRCEQFPTSGIS
jgi:hypothetical protein